MDKANLATETELSKDERAMALEISERMTEAFIWSYTPQGFDYWAEVVNNLRGLAGEDLDV